MRQGSTSPTGPKGADNRWRVLAVVAVAQFLVLLDSTVVNVAVPALASGLRASQQDLQWVLDAYLLTFGGFLLLGGRLADLHGRRRVFLAGLAVFALASLVCGLATGPHPLIAARALQGIGAAMLSPAALSIVVTSFPDASERRTALSVWGGLAVLGGTVGVLVGGVVVSELDWRWAFYANLPVAVGVAVAALMQVPPFHRALEASRHHDFLGAVTGTAGVSLVVFALIEAPREGWASGLVVATGLGGVVLVAAFVGIEARGRSPLMPLSLLRSPGFVDGGTGLMVVWAVQISIFFLSSVYLQAILGFSPLGAGAGLLAMGVPALLVVILLPRLMGRLGLSWTRLVGSVLLLAGTALLAAIPVDGEYVRDVMPGLLLLGLASPLCFVSLTTRGLSSLEMAMAGVGSGVLNTFGQLGAALGMATLVGFAHSSDAAAGVGGRVAGIHDALLAACVVAGVGVLLAVVAVARDRRAVARAG